MSFKYFNRYEMIEMSGNCIMWKIFKKNNLFQVVHTYVEPHHVIRKRAADQSLRILLYYDESVYRWAIYYYKHFLLLTFTATVIIQQITIDFPL